MFIVADAHVDPMGRHADPFLKLLDRLAETDGDVVFLGDIFDLWIALPGYETPLHRTFMAWCRDQRRRRRIGFVCGNHEFFVADTRKDAFTFCSDGPCELAGAGILLCHGDQVNSVDYQYLMFRRLIRNPITRGMLAVLPFQRLALDMKTGLKRTNTGFRKSLPEGEIRRYARERFDSGIQTIFMGHFHREFHWIDDLGRAIHGLPAWLDTRFVIAYDPDSGRLTRHNFG